MKNEFMAGTATRDITPTLPDDLSIMGMARKRPTRGVLYPLRAEALALSAGNETVFIVTCDQLFMRESLTAPVRKKVAEALGINDPVIFFGATHSHSSEFNRPEKSTPESDAWWKNQDQQLESALVEVCVEAFKNCVPAELASSVAKLKQPISSGRRMLLSNGSCIDYWAAGSIAIPGVKLMGIEAEPPVQIDVVGVRAMGAAEPFALLTSYPSHIHLIGLPYLDSEVAGAAKRTVEKRHPHLNMLYANGTAGDTAMGSTTPPPASGKLDEEQAWYEKHLTLFGNRFADAIDDALGALKYSRPKQIHIATFHEKQERVKMTRIQPKAGILIQAAAFGDTAILNIQGELFSQFGLDFHADSPFRNLLVVGYNEFGYSYIGTDLAYEQGSYEIKGVKPRTHEEEHALRELGINIISPEYSTLGKTIKDKTHDLLHKLAAEQGVH